MEPITGFGMEPITGFGMEPITGFGMEPITGIGVEKDNHDAWPSFSSASALWVPNTLLELLHCLFSTFCGSERSRNIVL